MQTRKCGDAPPTGGCSTHGSSKEGYAEEGRSEEGRSQEGFPQEVSVRAARPSGKIFGPRPASNPAGVSVSGVRFPRARRLRAGKLRAMPASLAKVDWPRVATDLDRHGCAAIERLLAKEECGAVADLYGRDALFRSRVVMARHGFGEGEYKYFAAPLPRLVAELRAALYARLAPVANRWHEALGLRRALPGRARRSSSRAATRPGRRARRRSCSATRRATTTASTRISTGSTSSRSRSRCSSPSPGETSRAASSC